MISQSHLQNSSVIFFFYFLLVLYGTNSAGKKHQYVSKSIECDLGIYQIVSGSEQICCSSSESSTTFPICDVHPLLKIKITSLKLSIILPLLPVCLSFLILPTSPRTANPASSSPVASPTLHRLKFYVFLIVSRVVFFFYALNYLEDLLFSSSFDFSDHLTYFFIQLLPPITIETMAVYKSKIPAMMKIPHLVYCLITNYIVALATLRTTRYFHTPLECLVGFSLAYTFVGSIN